MFRFDFFSIWPLIPCLAILVFFAALPLFRAADIPPNPTHPRIQTLDGLRGFLALAVFFHHAAIYHRYIVDGTWTAPASSFYSTLGPLGVSMFFVITGYLFWLQLLRNHGQPSWIRLYTGRLFRIAPLYLAMAAAVLATVLAQTGLHLHGSLRHLGLDLVRLFGLGFFTMADVNGYKFTAVLVAMVTWSLQYEWWFYLSLPVLAIAARFRRASLPIVLAALVLVEGALAAFPLGVYRHSIGYLPLFLLGMLCASLQQHGLLLLRVPDWLKSSLFVLLLLACLHFPDANSAMIPRLLVGTMIYLVLSGCSVFGLLTTRPARRLGDISYGIYLLQGLALAAVFRIPAIRPHEAASPLTHWALTLASALLLIVLATATHVWIERPGIDAGKCVSAALLRRIHA